MFIVFMFSFSVPPLSHLPISLFPRSPVFPFVLFHVFSFTCEPSPVSSSAVTHVSSCVTRLSSCRHPSFAFSSPVTRIPFARHPSPRHPSPVDRHPVTRHPSPRHPSPVTVATPVPVPSPPPGILIGPQRQLRKPQRPVPARSRAF